MQSRLEVNVITQHSRFKKKFKHAFGSVRSSKGGGNSSRSSSVTRRLGSVTRRLSFDLGAVNLSPGPATNSIFSVCKKNKGPSLRQNTILVRSSLQLPHLALKPLKQFLS